MISVCCIMPVHNREAITRETVYRLERQFCEVIPILVGNEETRKKLEDVPCCYVEHENRPIYKKLEAGLSMAKNFSPDAVMYLGSDDWISDNWLETAFEYFNCEDYHLAGQNTMALYMTKEDFSLWKIFNIYNDSGEVIHKKILDHFDWHLPELKDDTRHGIGRRDLIQSIGIQRARMQNTTIMGVKGLWKTYHNLDIHKKLYKAKEVLKREEYLNNNFPDAVERVMIVQESYKKGEGEK